MSTLNRSAQNLKSYLLVLLLPLLATCSPGAASYSTPAFSPSNPISSQNTLPETGIPVNNLGLTSTPTPSPTLTASPIPTFTPSPSITPTPQPTLPEEQYITNISGHRQFFPLGCETSAAIDWAVYFGVYINEYEFQHKIPLSDNPDLGFVGNVRDPWGQTPPYSYGVHAAPIAKLLTEYGLPAKGLKGFTLEEIKAEVAAGRPVIAWVIGNVEGGVPAEYTDSAGNTTIVAAYEHVVIVTGYSADRVRYLNNGRFYETPNEVFLNSWGVLENMVVVKSAETSPTPTP